MIKAATTYQNNPKLKLYNKKWSALDTAGFIKN